MRAWLSNQLEPSRLRATIVAGVALAASLGLVATADVPGWVDLVLPLAAVFLPYLQHWLVRPQVVPVAKIRAAIAAAPILTDGQRAELNRDLDAGSPPLLVAHMPSSYTPPASPAP